MDCTDQTVMPDILTILGDRLRQAIATAFGQEHADADPMLSAATNPRFGDYQANLAMGLAKQIGAKPRDIAQKIVDALDTSGVLEKVEIAGPGFINLHLTQAFLSDQITAQAGDERLGVPLADPPQTVVVDYSSPNVAKEMHVGHLRSTIIGDAIARLLDFQGHRVIRQNHVGDWGTQFGMLIEFMLDAAKDGNDLSGDTSDDKDEYSVRDLDDQYRQAKRRFDSDTDFAERARQRVVALQGGDETSLNLWRKLVGESFKHFEAIYHRLGVLLEPGDVRGESSFNDMLAQVVDDLSEAGVLETSQGAQVVYPEGFKDREGESMAMIVRKSDGGFLYATTDLAAARYRAQELHSDRIIYVTDARQARHFAMVFATLKNIGWVNADVKLEHLPFGSILGPNRAPFKTREGGTVKLVDLLDEAVRRAHAIVEEKDTDLSAEQRDAVAEAVGLGALKYADLSNDRIKDYVFDWNRMLSFEGNTAPYLQNAYVRIRSIFRKGEIDPATLSDAAIIVREQPERRLALQLLGLPHVIDQVARTLEPHRLCTCLYELAATYHKFYETCPVLREGDAAIRASRLRLSDLTARTLRCGLNMLGIQVVEKM